MIFIKIYIKVSKLQVLPACAIEKALSLEYARNSFWLLPRGHCEQKPLHLEKTTSSVLSVIVNNLNRLPVLEISGYHCSKAKGVIKES